jgi:hypothetical protein
MFDDQGKLDYQLYQPGAVLTVLPAKKLFASKAHQALLHYIRDYSDIPAEYYQPLYEKVLFDYAEFVQHLPITEEDYLGSLLNEGLTRALNALYKHQSAKKNRLDAREKDHLVTYAIFTAALFSGVSAAVTNQTVLITDKKGFVDSKWDSYRGSMIDLGAKYYKLRPRAKIYSAIDHWITPVLARQLLPEEAFHWLASDVRVFNDWLAALQGEVLIGGQISDLLNYIRHLDDILIGLDLERLPPAHAEINMPDEAEMPEKFLKWLQEELEKQKLSINKPDSMVHMLKQGVFLLESSLYRYFLAKAGMSSEAQMRSTSVAAQLGYALGELQRISCFSQFDQQSKRFGSAFITHQSSMKTGLVLADPSLLFRKGNIPTTSPYMRSEGTAMKVSLPNLQRLNSNNTPTAPGPKGRIF